MHIVLLLLLWQSTSPGGAVRGVVLDHEHKPLPQATVYALPAEHMTSPVTTSTDDDGHFTFKGLPPGEVYLDAAKSSAGYPYSMFSFFISPGEDKPKITLRDGQEVGNAVVQLGERTAYLRLIVVNSKGEQVPCTLTFTRPDLAHEGRWDTSFDPSAPIHVPPVPFSFTIRAAGYQLWRSHDPSGTKDLMVLKPGEERSLTVVLTPAPDSAQ